jgi:hypothetical protein
MTKNKIVVRFKDSTLLKGTVSVFSPFRKYFQLEIPDGNLVTVNIDRIKAMFFVKSFEGDKKYNYTFKDDLFWVGDKIMVKFNDGEKLVGYTEQLDCSPKGFFITPADLNGNNKYVFASKSAIKSMSFF